MKKIKYVIVHESESTWGCASIIRQWHIERGFRDIGYNVVVLNGHISSDNFYMPSLNGSIEIGRPFDGDSFIEENEQGAHALGYNAESFGVCMIGKSGQFTSAQTKNLLNLLTDLINQYQIRVDDILGHYETRSGREQGKTCPDMDMRLFRRTLRERLVGD